MNNNYWELTVLETQKKTILFLHVVYFFYLSIYKVTSILNPLTVS